MPVGTTICVCRVRAAHDAVAPFDRPGQRARPAAWHARAFSAGSVGASPGRLARSKDDPVHRVAASRRRFDAHRELPLSEAMAEIPVPARRPLRFSSFELDLHSGELRKAGVLVGLQEQSLKVLVELLDRPGDLVTREQLRQRLWPNGTFVDFEHGLNAIINRLRETLGDSAESPRFIQTVPRRGYRFIAPVEGALVDARTEDPTSTAVLDDAARRPNCDCGCGLQGQRPSSRFSRWRSAATVAGPSTSAGRERATQSRAADETWPAAKRGQPLLPTASRWRSRGPARSSTTPTSMSRWSARQVFGA